jgi:hypothetical protein
VGAAAIFGGQGTPEEADNSKGFETYGESDKNTFCLPRQRMSLRGGTCFVGKSRQIAAVRHKSTTVLLRSTIVV